MSFRSSAKLNQFCSRSPGNFGRFCSNQRFSLLLRNSCFIQTFENFCLTTNLMWDTWPIGELHPSIFSRQTCGNRIRVSPVVVISSGHVDCREFYLIPTGVVILFVFGFSLVFLLKISTKLQIFRLRTCSRKFSVHHDCKPNPKWNSGPNFHTFAKLWRTSINFHLHSKYHPWYLLSCARTSVLKAWKYSIAQWNLFIFLRFFQ